MHAFNNKFRLSSFRPSFPLSTLFGGTPRLTYAYCALRCLIPLEAADLSATAVACAATAFCWICFFCAGVAVDLRADELRRKRVGMTIREVNNMRARRREQNLFLFWFWRKRKVVKRIPSGERGATFGADPSLV